MNSPIPDFPHDEMPEDEINRTPKATIQRPRKSYGKSFLRKFLFVILIAALILGGILYFQRMLLDLEAQAQVLAIQTVTAASSSNLSITTLNPANAFSTKTATAFTAEVSSTPLAKIVETVANPLP